MQVLFSENLVGQNYNTKIIETISNEDTIEVEVQLDVLTLQILGNYKNAIIYLAVSKYNGNEKEIFWTNTFAKELELA
jgi:hypothetical protein